MADLNGRLLGGGASLPVRKPSHKPLMGVCDGCRKHPVEIVEKSQHGRYCLACHNERFRKWQAIPTSSSGRSQR